MSFTIPDLKGKVFMVTGSSSGMGRAIALGLAEQGAHVALFDLVRSDEVAKEISHLHDGSKALVLQGDVTSTAEVDAAHEQTVQHFGRLDGAANMAGIVGFKKAGDPNHGVEKLDDAGWDKVMNTNVDGVRKCMRAQLRLMKGPGAIVNAASTAGQGATPWAVPYSSSKWTVIGMTKGAAGEVGNRKIRINAVAPGFIKTAFNAPFSFSALEQHYGPRISLGRMGEATEVAKVAIFLLSDVTSYMTGSVVNVDGGWM